MSQLKRLLVHPLTSGMDVDDPRTTVLRREIIRSKPFLKKLYREWYELIRNRLPPINGDVVELGSGAGFLKEVIPDAITTDVIEIEGIDRVLRSDGVLPFPDQTVRAIVMTDVLHHIGNPRSFLMEAARVVSPGGAVIMIEPWVTVWSSIIYRRLHSEPFDPSAPAWEFPVSGPLSGANGALPWMMFERDRHLFETEFPEWNISEIKLMMPFVYLLSGGVSMRALCPGWMYRPCRIMEAFGALLNRHLAMFALVGLTRV